MVKGKFNNLSVICVHASTEEKEDVIKYAFYDKIFQWCPAYYTKIAI